MKTNHPVRESSEIALSSDDFRFAYHRSPSRFLHGGRRPYRLIHSQPSLQTYQNAIYTPVVRTSDQRLGCLYDEQLRRIDNSCTRRYLNDLIWNTDPVRYAGNPGDLPVYEEPVVYLGYINAHFGHFLLETISRWWPLVDQTREVDRYLVHVFNPKDLDLPFIKECLAALNIDREKIVFFDHPIRIKHVSVPEQSFQLNSHIFTAYKDIFQALAISFGLEGIEQTDQPVYLSKSLVSHGVGHFIGEDKIESFLSGKGVRIIHPQQLTYKEQLQVINEHRHIIGFQGSQLISIAAALQPKQVTWLTDHRVFATNCLISKCCELDSVFVKASRIKNPIVTSARLYLPKITGRFSYNPKGFNITYEVDHERAIEWFSRSGLV